MQRNAEAAGQTTERGGLFFLFIWVFLIFTSTFTDMVIAGVDTADAGSNLANMLFALCLIFCGVLASPSALPGFWIFMYRVSPFTYLVDGILSTGLANTLVTCSNIEFLHFEPSNGTSCGQYLSNYISFAGGYLQNPEATTDCQFCTVRDTNTLLHGMSLSYDLRWRNFGIMWVFIVFNVAGAFFLYWWVRVPKTKREGRCTTDSRRLRTKENTQEQGVLAEVESTEKRLSAPNGPVTTPPLKDESGCVERRAPTGASQDMTVAHEGSTSVLVSGSPASSTRRDVEGRAGRTGELSG
jgi:hypothetical protein